MTVFKNVFKLLRHHIKTLSLYSIIYLVVVILAIQSAPSTTSGALDVPYLYLNNQDSSVLTNHLVDYLDEKTNIVEVDEATLDDALFHREIHSYIIIPKGFTDDFVSDNSPQLTLKTTGDMSGGFVESVVIQFLNTTQSYLLVNESLDENMMNQVSDVLDQEVSVTFQELQEDEAFLMNKTAHYFVLLNYPLITQIILAVGLILSSYKNLHIQRRQQISFMSSTTYTFQLLSSNLMVSLVTWALYMIVCFILEPQGMLSYGLPHGFNAFVFTLTMSAFAYMVTTMFYHKDTISMIATVFGLGASFITGVFVPRELIASGVIKLSKVFPSYWYVDNALRMGNNDFGSYWSQLGVLVLFMICFVLISLFVEHKRSS